MCLQKELAKCPLNAATIYMYLAGSEIEESINARHPDVTLDRHNETMSTHVSNLCRSTSYMLLNVVTRRKNYGDRAFSSFTPMLWNGLPLVV